MMRGYILAGGASRRLGSDKRFARLGAETMIERTVRILREAVDSCFVVAKEPVLDDVEFVADRLLLRSAISGVEAALAHASSEELVILLACDYPLLEARTVRSLMELAERDAARVQAHIPRAGGRSHPLVGVWQPALGTLVRQQIDQGDLKLMNVLGKAVVRYVDHEDLGCEEIEFLNVNEPAELELARRIAVERQLQSS